MRKPEIGSVSITNQSRAFLLNGQLNLRQPVLYIFLIPDAVDIAFPMQAGSSKQIGGTSYESLA
jgi:hypothetical protein